ncbi:glycoside hydrolase family 30 protein [Flavobacterium sp. RSSA_27]|uniref:glycoside hydrolase family 30 protein n=1 Tax=Flavobacterium sp. RSSA_27 TaxID=3447667 RepID=UPI003F2A6030
MKRYFILLVLVFNYSFAQTSIITKNKVMANKKITVYTTAKDTKLKLTLTDSVAFIKASQTLETQIAIFVQPHKTFQKILGIGGAITDASAEVFAKIPNEKQKEFLKSYYDETYGIGYSLLRTTIHSSDFSSESYTYVRENDADLQSFDIAHDKKFRIPLLQQAIITAKGKLLTYASPWSPPSFMKSTKNMLKGGKLLPEFCQSWANYYVKFIKAYEKEGIPIWGLTIQNEPMATQTWESCIYTAEEERDFLKNYLGPTLHKNGLKEKKVIVWDHNRDLINHRAAVIFNDPKAAQYAWGIGFHWYENWSGGAPMFDNIRKVHEAFPDKNLIFTEGCNEKFDNTKYEYWPNAERYGTAMINDFNNGTVAWTDWNILLDEKGGPNHVGNFCFAPVHYDIHKEQLIYTPSYYYIGHFSKFVRPEAQRVSTATSRSSLLSTSFINSNGEMVTIVMNATNQKIDYQLIIDQKAASLSIPANAIQTLLY